jgi:hypothetical protein
MDAPRSFYLNSDHDDHAELTTKADRSNAVAISYVTPANDNVPTSLRLRAHWRALLRRLVAEDHRDLRAATRRDPRRWCAHPVRDHFLRREAFRVLLPPNAD